MKLDSRFETKRVQIGLFEVYWEGKKTEYQIVNGSLGVSGRDTANIYCIYNPKTEKVTPVGPLRSCKSMLSHTLHKRARLQSELDRISNPEVAQRVDPFYA